MTKKREQPSLETGDYTQEELLKLVAFFINSDNLKFKFKMEREGLLKKKEPVQYTSKELWEVNSKGEMFGIFNCMKFVLNGLTQGLFAKEFMDEIFPISKDDEIEPDEKWATGIGLQCICLLFEVDPTFKIWADAVFYKTSTMKKKKD